jgi:hypothetical protein
MNETLIGWKEIKGWKLSELMQIVTSMADQDSRRLREIIRRYGVRSPEDLLFITPEEYKQAKGAGKMFFLNMKKVLCEHGIPYDTETEKQILERIENGQSKNDALTKMRFEILNRDGFTCQYCGRGPRNGGNVILQIDHIHPEAKGGPWKKENLVTSCRECNGGKSDILLEEINK